MQIVLQTVMRVGFSDSCCVPWPQVMYEGEPKKGNGKLWVHEWGWHGGSFTVVWAGTQQAFDLATLNITLKIYFPSGVDGFF